jgi:hypothetical protein
MVAVAELGQSPTIPTVAILATVAAVESCSYPTTIIGNSQATTAGTQPQLLSHPGSRKQNRSLHTCAQDVQITRTTNNMVNRYNISLNYKLESLQNDPWIQKKYYRVARNSKHRCGFHRHNQRRGRPSLYLLAPAGTLGWTPAFCLT